MKMNKNKFKINEFGWSCDPPYDDETAVIKH